MSANVFDNGSLDHYGFVNNGLKAVNVNNVGRKKCVKKSQNISSTGGLANIFQGQNSNISFLLPMGVANLIDVCETITLELTLVNGDAANAATLLAGNFMISNIQTLTANQLEQSWPEHQMVRETLLAPNDEYITQKAAIGNYSYSYAAGYSGPSATIAASGTKKIYIQLYTMLDVCQLFLPAISNQITLQVYFNSTGVTSGSASTTLSVSNARLIMNGFKYEDQIRNALLTRFASRPHYYGYNLAQRETLSSITVSAANDATVQFSAFSNFKLPCLILAVRAAGASQEALYAFDKIATLDERINGQSLYLTELDNEEFLQMAINEGGIRNTVPGSATNLLMLPHSDDVYQSLKYNMQRGYVMYNPNVNMVFRMDSASGSRDIIGIAFQSVAVKIENGQLSVEYL